MENILLLQFIIPRHQGRDPRRDPRPRHPDTVALAAPVLSGQFSPYCDSPLVLKHLEYYLLHCAMCIKLLNVFIIFPYAISDHVRGSQVTGHAAVCLQTFYRLIQSWKETESGQSDGKSASYIQQCCNYLKTCHSGSLREQLLRVAGPAAARQAAAHAVVQHRRHRRGRRRDGAQREVGRLRRGAAGRVGVLAAAQVCKKKEGQENRRKPIKKY